MRSTSYMGMLKKWAYLHLKLSQASDFIGQIVTKKKNDYNHKLALKLSDLKNSSKTYHPSLAISR